MSERSLVERQVTLPATDAFWRRPIFRNLVFRGIIIGCLLFILLTTIGMFTFPGGTNTNPNLRSYSFTQNFFSDLGRVHTRSGADNTASRILFMVALSLAGAALIVFFLAFTQFFRRPRWVQAFSLLGTLLGIAAGVCFVGIAFTPADVNGPLHGQFVVWAFRLFLFAVVAYLPALFGAAPASGRRYPKAFALVFVGFAALLAGYLWLLTAGPSARSPEGLLIQVVGQKVIAYASILSVALQSWGALRTNAHHPQMTQISTETGVRSSNLRKSA